MANELVRSVIAFTFALARFVIPAVSANTSLVRTP